MAEPSIMNLFPYKVEETPVIQAMPWNIAQVCADRFWPLTKGGGRVVAVVDTGLDVSHPEFTGRVFRPMNFTTDGGSQDVTDVMGHGTHVAGIIGGVGVGIAPDCRIMPLKVFGSGNGFQWQDALSFILNYNKTAAEADKVVAVNCSWGGPYDAMVHYYIRQLIVQGVVVCVSAGNAGDGKAETSEIFNWPGFLWEVITIGATDQLQAPAGYSSSYDGIDLAAPGTDIYSAWPGGGYKLLSGTSMAAPHVAGAVALLADAWHIREGKLGASDDMEALLFKHIGTLNHSEKLVGAGLLDLTYLTKRWPLWRVQLGAFYNKVGADVTKDRATNSGLNTYIVKY